MKEFAYFAMYLSAWSLFALAFTAFVRLMVWVGDKLPECNCSECDLVRGAIDEEP